MEAAITLRERREAVVREHMESENQHRFDISLGTFDHPATSSCPPARSSTEWRR